MKGSSNLGRALESLPSVDARCFCLSGVRQRYGTNSRLAFPRPDLELYPHSNEKAAV